MRTAASSAAGSACRSRISTRSSQRRSVSSTRRARSWRTWSATARRTHGGVQAGDVITKFNGHEIDSARTLSRVVADATPSETANVTVWRDGKSRELKVKLGEAAKSEQVAAAGPGGRRRHRCARPHAARLDGRGQERSSEFRAASPARSWRGGCRTAPPPRRACSPGDVITKVNQKDVEHGGRRGRRAERGESEKTPVRCSSCAAATRSGS